jgi:hypothetical protein
MPRSAAEQFLFAVLADVGGEEAAGEVVQQVLDLYEHILMEDLAFAERLKIMGHHDVAAEVLANLGLVESCREELAKTSGATRRETRARIRQVLVDFTERPRD